MPETLEEALAWRDETINRYLVEGLGIGEAGTKLASFGASADARYLPPEQRMAVGVAFRESFGLALRVGKRGGKAEGMAQEIAKKGQDEGRWVDVGYIGDLSVAPRTETVQQNVTGTDDFEADARPVLRIGMSVGHSRAPAGSLGAFVQRKGKAGVLGACHVLANAGRSATTVGEDASRIYHPSPADAENGVSARNEIARLFDFAPLDSGAVFVDAAVAMLNRGWDLSGNIVPDIPGTPANKIGKPIGQPPAKIVPGKVGTVAKAGRRTNFTTGKLTAGYFNDVPIRIPALGIVYYNQLYEVEADPDRPFAEGGDSGALVFDIDNMTGVGLVVGGGLMERDGQERHCTYCCDLNRALAQLKVKWY